MLEINLFSLKSVPTIFAYIQITTVSFARLIFFVLAATQVSAATGPTLQLDYGRGPTASNSISEFMYFVPLIAPESVSVITNAGNTQSARVQSFSCTTNGSTFLATCEFQFTGQGFQQNIFDLSAKIKKRDAELRAGHPLTRQLDSINVEGAGSGTVEITGALTNGQHHVTEVRLRFNSHGHPSPVSVCLVDICWRNDRVERINALTARVNSLVFRQKPDAPKMEVSLASVKRKEAGDSLWQNFVGELKGAAANLFLPPMSIEAGGQQAMLDFGLALATEKPSFTFPNATRLKSVGLAQ